MQYGRIFVLGVNVLNRCDESKLARKQNVPLNTEDNIYFSHSSTYRSLHMEFITNFAFIYLKMDIFVNTEYLIRKSLVSLLEL